MNLDKIRRQRVSSCPIGRHLTGLSLINSNPENNEEEEESQDTVPADAVRLKEVKEQLENGIGGERLQRYYN